MAPERHPHSCAHWADFLTQPRRLLGGQAHTPAPGAHISEVSHDMSVWGQRSGSYEAADLLRIFIKSRALFSDNVGQTAEYVDLGDGASPRVQASREYQLWA